MVFEFDGKKYGSASTHQKEWGSKIIHELDLRGDESVLDLGCGDGVLTSMISELLPQGRVLGIDASHGMIEVANEKLSRLPELRGNLQFVVMDINNISFNYEFDVIFSNAALHWVKDHIGLLSNVKRALRQDGIIRFNFAGDGNCSNFFDVIRKAMSLEEYSSYFIDFEWPWYMPAVEDYKRLVHQAGFSSSRVWGENADREFPDADAMIKWIDQPSIVPFLAYIPEVRREEFRRTVISSMLEKTKQDNGNYFETFRRINVLARN